LHLAAFSRSVVDACRQEKPTALLATGQTPLDAATLREIGHMGIRRVNYSTDDPWNPDHRAQWFLDALPQYDAVFSTRQANLEDFRGSGCKSVSWLPFGYDEALWVSGAASPRPAQAAAQVFFAGAAEDYRIECVRALNAAGIRVAVAGDFWNRTAGVRDCWVGHLSAAELRAWTRSTPIALCLARRANRDGHVMRSFEIPAIGACMVAEDTAEHRALFGEDGTAVRYFGSAAEAVQIVNELRASPAEIARLAAAARELITSSPNSYADRLCTLVGGAGPKGRLQ
jgi:hypothetical protein